MRNRATFKVTCGVAVVIGIVFVGCGSPKNLSKSTPVQSSEFAPRNCLILVLDAAPYKHFSFSGRTSQTTTPFIDSLAATHANFVSAYSQSNVTSNSAISYMTGRYSNPSGAGVMIPKIDESRPVLAEAFDAAGFRTALFSVNPFITPQLGFARGVDHYVAYDAMPLSALFLNSEDDASYRRDQASTLRLMTDLTQWIGESQGESWFAYVHILRPHSPYVAIEPYLSDYLEAHSTPPKKELFAFEGRTLRGYLKEGEMPPDEDVETLRQLFLGNLAYTDKLVEDLFKQLEALGCLDETLVVITSDHGEAFMEHGRLTHGQQVYDEDVHVPLLFVAPGLEGEFEDVVELVDLFPTLADVFSLQTAGGELEGRSLVPYFRNTPNPYPHRMAHSLATTGDMLSVRQGSRKLIARLDETKTIVSAEFYDLSVDPDEQSPHPAAGSVDMSLLARAEQYIRQYMMGIQPEKERLADEQIEKLQALGYLQE